MRLIMPTIGGGAGPISQPVNVILLTGQSNSIGVGENSDATAEELEVSSDLLIWNESMQGFQGLEIGANNIGASSSKHGIELGLESEIIDSFNTPVHLIKWGVSATGIVEHLPGGSVYDPFWTDYVRVGINSLINAGNTVRVSLVFIQGEKDSNTTEDTNAYSSRLDSWVSQWQSNLGAGLPINLVEIYETNANDTTINTAFANKATLEGNVNVIETGDLSSFDNLHWGYEQLKVIADRVVSSIKTQDALTITETI